MKRYAARAILCALCLMLAVMRAASAQESGLAWLSVQNGVFSPVFSADRNTYYAILENGIHTYEEAGVQMRPVHADARITTTCLDALSDGESLPEGRRVTYLVTVEETSGEVARYYLRLYRKAAYTAPIQNGLQLANLTINGGAIAVPDFSGIKAYYEVTVPQDVKELDIVAYPQDRSKMAKVIGVPKQMPDEPVCVNILVTSEDAQEQSVYTLVLKRGGFAQAKAFTALELAVSAAAALILGGLAVFFAVGRKKA